MSTIPVRPGPTAARRRSATAYWDAPPAAVRSPTRNRPVRRLPRPRASENPNRASDLLEDLDPIVRQALPAGLGQQAFNGWRKNLASRLPADLQVQTGCLPGRTRKMQAS